MTSRPIERIVLVTTALVLIGVGLGGALVPAAFYASYEIAVAGASLSSELRGVGAVLLLLGLAVAAGAVWMRWAFPSAVIGAIVGLGLALGRTVALLVDGVPASTILVAGAVEAVLGAACAWVAIRRRPRE